MKPVNFLIFAILFLLSANLFAQENQYRAAQDSDPAARKLVESIRKKYDAYETLSADFRLAIALPNQPVETQKGSVSRQGDLVRFRLGNQEGIITADAAYIVLHDSKEVQINDLPDPGEMTGVLTPQTLFSFYEGDNYVLSIQGDDYVEGRHLTNIELKPVDRNNSDFTKLRLLVDRKTEEITSVKAMTRDGSSYTFFLDKTNGNPKLASTTFTFDKKDFPGYHVEDLRY